MVATKKRTTKTASDDAPVKSKSKPKAPVEKRSNARAYVPLISRHRPKTFAEMIGMKSTVDAVAKSIEDGEIPNAYLLMGNTGCGKTTFARVIARAVMCEEYTGCGKCRSCITFDENPDSHMDYEEVNCGEKGKIEDIRGLIQLGNTSPMLGKMRVIVLDEAHRLSGASAEAILKPLEEPAEKTLWILATTESQSLKDTLKNRCNLISIRPADREQLAEYLAELARDYINYPVEDIVEITEQIAEMTGGLIRTSLSILDTVIKTYRSTKGSMDVHEFLAEVREEILKNTDADALSAQKIVMGVVLGNPKIILSILGDHANFVGLSRNILDTSQYLLDNAFGVRGSNIYHPPAFRDTANELEAKLTERQMKKVDRIAVYTQLLNASVETHSNIMKFIVPERPLLSSNLLNLMLSLREIVPKKATKDD